MNGKAIATVVLLSLLLVGATPLLVPVTATGPEDLRDLRLGAPVPFIRQESSLTPPPEWFPQRLTLLSPWEHPTRILWGNLAASLAIAGVALLTQGAGLRRALR